MEPPAGGRRHNRGFSSRSGAISVAELIRKQPKPVRIQSAEEAATDGLVTDLLGAEREPHYIEPRRSTGVKLLGIVVAAMALCGTVAAASMITNTRQEAAPPAPVTAPAPAPITGVSALRPDLLGTEVNGSSAITSTAAPSATGTTAQPTTSQQPLGAGSPRAKAATAPTPVAQTPVEVVRQFYALVTQDPGGALKLVSSALGSFDPAGFVRSWSAVRTLRTDRIEVQPDNSVLGVIAIQQPDGSWLRVEQVLRLDDQTPPKIIGAEVLSAQRG